MDARVESGSELVERARCGDQAALVEIYQRFQPPVFTYIYYRVEDQCLAEDLTSEVFTRLVAKLPEFQHQDRPLLAWLYTIARNLVIDHYRSDHRAPFSLDESLIAGESDQTARLAENRLAQECLGKALAQLTEEQRLVILLKFMEGRSNAEVGKILDKTEGSVKSLQHRALAALHRALKKERCYEA
jgi:RNA polymerase sigma-70 factor (ECF subfamily)